MNGPSAADFARVMKHVLISPRWCCRRVTRLTIHLPSGTWPLHATHAQTRGSHSAGKTQHNSAALILEMSSICTLLLDWKRRGRRQVHEPQSTNARNSL